MAVIGVKGEAVAIRDYDKEKVEKDFFLTQNSQKSIGNEAVRDKAKPSLNASDPVGNKDFFLDHDRLLSGYTLILGKAGRRTNPSSNLKPTITNRFSVSFMLIPPRGANLRPLKRWVTPRLVLKTIIFYFF